MDPGKYVMRFERLQDVFDNAKAIHQRLSDYYHTLRDETKQERVRMLLEYLSRHEQQMVDTLRNFKENAAKDLLNTYIEYGPDEATTSKINNIEIRSDMDVDEVIRQAIAFDNCIIELYQEMAERAAARDVKDVLNNLLETEKHEKLKAVRNALMVKEL